MRCWGVELAVKVFEAEKFCKALAEASIAERVSGHPHLVCLCDAILNPDTQQAYLVYGFAGSCLSAANDSANALQVIARQTFAGIAHLHSYGLYHADVKPANIFVLSTGDGLRVRLGDLGNVAEVGSLASVRLRSPRTTMWFRAPELLEGQIEATGEEWLRADIWAMGIALCDLLGLAFHRLTFSPKAKEEKTCRDMLERLRPLRHGTLAWPRSVAQKIGSVGVDFLDFVLSWGVSERPSAAACLLHQWLCAHGRLVGLGGSSPPHHLPGRAAQLDHVAGVHVSRCAGVAAGGLQRRGGLESCCSRPAGRD